MYIGGESILAAEDAAVSVTPATSPSTKRGKKGYELSVYSITCIM